MPGGTSPKAKPSLSDVVDDIGLGPAQLRVGILAGGVWAADGSELLLISSVASTLATEWSLSPFWKGFVVTVVYTGLMLGNVGSGPLGAHLGRRELVIASYLGIFVFSILSSMSPHLLVLLIVRFFVGVSIGLGQPAALAMGLESSPTGWRIFTNGMSQALFTLGEVYSALLLMTDDPKLQDLNWRRLIQLGAIPALVLLFMSIFLLQQSPTFLLMKGRHREAVRVLENMRSDNGACDVSLDFTLPPKASRSSIPNSSTDSTDGLLDMFWGQMKVISSSKLLVPTIIVSGTCFQLNLTYYGSLYAFPQVLSSLVQEGAAIQLLLGAFWEFPGLAIGIALGMFYTRKSGSKIYLTLTACVLLLFIIGGNNQRQHWAFHIALYGGYYGIKMVPLIGFVLIYQVASELYPAEARTLGVGICLASGRLAAMLGPLIFEMLLSISGTSFTFFLLMAAIAILNLYVIDWVPETSSRMDREA
mmetsp:Transcript_73153/g.171528  ORF Transcript_73153/g.171528 Transcript_73153/m.171528 type:complete len:475 (+) Transcript_73153:120-1544(+)